MNILVTGSNGQLGSEIRRLAPQSEYLRFIFTDVAELDITSPDAIDRFVDENDIDIIINCAAYTAVDKAESEAGLCERLNGVAPGYLAQAMERRGGGIVHVSTDYVFDGKAYVPYTEDAPTAPTTVYGRTKLQGEQIVLKSCRKSMIIRTAWLYSTYGNNFVKSILKYAREKSELGVVIDQIGTPTYARDLANTILHVITKGINPGIYHFSNEGVCSWYDFATAIVKEANITSCKVSPILTEQYPTPAQRPHFSLLNKAKIKTAYHIEIPHWTESLHECIAALNA